MFLRPLYCRSLAGRRWWRPPACGRGRLAGGVPLLGKRGASGAAGPHPCTPSPCCHRAWPPCHQNDRRCGYHTPARLKAGEDPGLGAARLTPAPGLCSRGWRTERLRPIKKKAGPGSAVWRSGAAGKRAVTLAAAVLACPLPQSPPGPGRSRCAIDPSVGGWGAQHVRTEISPVDSSGFPRPSSTEIRFQNIPSSPRILLAGASCAASPGPQVCFRLHRFAFCGRFLQTESATWPSVAGFSHAACLRGSPRWSVGRDSAPLPGRVAIRRAGGPHGGDGPGGGAPVRISCESGAVHGTVRCPT